MDFKRKPQISPHQITGAAEPLSSNLAGRQKRYFISMMIRTGCFLLTVIVPSPWRWIFFVGAFTLPYIAVVVANAGRERESAPTAPVIARELGS